MGDGEEGEEEEEATDEKREPGMWDEGLVVVLLMGSIPLGRDGEDMLPTV